MNKRRSFGDVESDEDRFIKKPRLSAGPEESIEDKLDELIVRIGEKSVSSIDKNIDDLANLFNFDLLPKNTRIVDVFCECVVEFPQKVCIYSTLIGLLNVRNYSFGGEVVEKLIVDFRNYLKQGHYDKARVLVRFFGDLVNTRVISSTSLISLFENLIDVSMEDNVPQVRRDYFVYTVLSALPWVGKELYEKKEQELDQILSSIDSYINKRSKAFHHPALRVWHSDDPHPQEEYLDCLWAQILKLREEKWVDSHIYRPYIHFDTLLCEALQHNIPAIKPPAHEPTNLYPYPRVVFRLFDYTDCPERTILPGVHAIERFLVEDNLRCILNQTCYDRKDCASALLSYSNLSMSTKIPIDYIIIEVIFGEIFNLPKSEHPEICYGSIFLDLCRLQPSTFPPALAQGVDLLFDRLDTMNAACINRFASWFAYHLSNFQFRFNWDEWSISLKYESLHPKPKFIAETLERCLRLSYHGRVLESVPQNFHKLAPPPPAPVNKYKIKKPKVAKKNKNNDDSMETDDGESKQKEIENANAKQEEEEDDDEEEEEIVNEAIPGANHAIAIEDAIKQKCTPDEMLELLNAISPASLDINSESLLIDPIKIDVFVTTLLNVASKSMTHCFAMIAKYAPVLKTLNQTEEAQLSILNAIHSVWSSHPQLQVVLIDKLMKSEVLQNASVAIWCFTKSGTEEFMKFYMWEILHSTIKRTVKAIKRCTKELNETREKFNNQMSEGGDEGNVGEESQITDDASGGGGDNGAGDCDGTESKQPQKITYEVVEKLEEKLDTLHSEQKNLFLIIFQRFIMILTEHIASCEAQNESFRNYWFFWTLSRLQEIFFEYNEYIFKYITTYESLLFTNDLDQNILLIFKQFSSLRN